MSMPLFSQGLMTDLTQLRRHKDCAVVLVTPQLHMTLRQKEVMRCPGPNSCRSPHMVRQLLIDAPDTGQTRWNVFWRCTSC